MLFFSTRNHTIKKTPSQAILEGIAPDGGLYIPEFFPPFPIDHLSEMSDADISTYILSSLFDDFSKEEIESFVHAAYDTSFENGEISPLKEVGESYVMELWHGPTCAFKDVALQVLPYLLTASAKKCGVSDNICILTATSGDTGSAALAGFSDVAGTSIIVFYPDGGVSPMQKKQMVSCSGKNTSVAAIRGNFDDAQSGVKRIFSELTPPAGVRFSSANSINIGRLAPQIAYYFIAYRSLLSRGKITMGDKINFVVPTGNFGDILAGYFAKKMGLPVGKLICASNENRVLADFFETGVYDKRRDFHLTSSPSMDILISSNLERLVAMFCGAETTCKLMEELRQSGVYQIEKCVIEKISEEFSANWASQEETAQTIRDVFERYGYLLDPHTAVAMCVLGKSNDCEEIQESPTVVLSTASPYKFTKNVLAALGVDSTGNEFSDLQVLYELSKMPIPSALSRLQTATVYHNTVVEIKEMETYVSTCVKEKA